MSPILGQLRHVGRMGRDLMGHWHTNGARWPLVVLFLVLAVATVAVL